MSWLTGLAGKAEALLDRMDQVAAASLQSASPKKEEPALVTAPPRSESTPTLTEAAAKRSTPLPGPERYTKEQTSTTPRTALSQRSKQPPSDEALLNFLNTPSKETAGRETVQKEFASKRPLQTTPRPVPAMVPAQPKDEVGPVDVAIANKDTGECHVRCSSSVLTCLPLDAGDSTDGSKHQPSTDTDSAVAPTQSQQGSSEPSLQKGSDFEGTAIIQTHPEGNQLLQLQQKASNLELENKLLKEEVRSLTSELEVLRRHSAEMKDTLHHYESEVDSLREEVTRTDHMIRQLRSGEEDTKAELDARNSQIQARVHPLDPPLGSLLLEPTHWDPYKPHVPGHSHYTLGCWDIVFLWSELCTHTRAHTQHTRAHTQHTCKHIHTHTHTHPIGSSYAVGGGR